MVPAGVFNQVDDAMIVEVRVDAVVGLQASIYPAGTVNIDVDWGDGQSESFVSGGIKNHSYASAGTYMIKITGAMSGWGVATGSNKQKVYSIQSWGDLGIINLENACAQMANLNYVASPPSSVTNMNRMFIGATVFNQDISGWDVSNVTNISFMFNNASFFNQDISVWDVSNVTNMSTTFANATSFNQDISGWDVSNVTNMVNMFYGATVFNQDLSGWCVINFISQPAGFSTNTPAWTLPKPVWGTCP